MNFMKKIRRYDLSTLLRTILLSIQYLCLTKILSMPIYANTVPKT